MSPVVHAFLTKSTGMEALPVACFPQSFSFFLFQIVLDLKSDIFTTKAFA